jgi:hypothetical protein
MDNYGTYISSDNGHLNQKNQMYRNGKPIRHSITQENSSPGPGAYDTNKSLIGSFNGKTSNPRMATKGNMSQTTRFSSR